MKGTITKLMEWFRNNPGPTNLSNLVMGLGDDQRGRPYRSSAVESSLFANGDLFYNTGDGYWRATNKVFHRPEPVIETETDLMMLGEFDVET